jgi:protein-S-isoprenylcysteine O-methyltransferase Ste14
VSRWLVTAAFLALAIPTAEQAVQEYLRAAGTNELAHWAVVGYAVLKAAIVSAFVVFVFGRGPARRPSREPVAFVACAAAIVAVVMLRRPAEGIATPLVLAGEVVALLSCAWLLWAVLKLGKCFGVLPEARGLVTRGPYGIVRHPVYLGEFGACAGLVIASPSIWNLCVAVVFFLAQSVRMKLEEQALTREFPEYADYAARTPKLVPRAQLPMRRLATGADEL